jgi:uncharacterized coiled-coil DUF342 family protein
MATERDELILQARELIEDPPRLIAKHEELVKKIRAQSKD